MRQQIYRLGLLTLLAAGAAAAQPAQAQVFFQQPSGQPQAAGGRGGRGQLQQLLNYFGATSTMRLGPGAQGRWWNNPHMVELVGLTPDQVKKMDDIFQQHRLQLIDLNASLEKEETILEPLVGADQPDDAKVLAQIDRVAQARAELEKANSRMLWSIRRVLTLEQWKKLPSFLSGGGGRQPVSTPAKMR
jgi:Spy/CpxP family protein refolding chaperone